MHGLILFGAPTRSVIMKILIAVPTFESIYPETFKSIYGLQKPEDTTVMFDFIKGYDCAVARNTIVDEAIMYGFDYILMVDSDIILPQDTLLKMLDNPTDILLGVYPRKNTYIGQTEIFKLGTKDFVDENNLNISELEALPSRFKIKGGGLGCALICSEVFLKLPNPWFRYVQYDNGSVLSEDNYFCHTAAKAGFNIEVDTTIRCGHLSHEVRYC